MSWFAAPAPLLPEIFARHGRHRPARPALVVDDTRLDWHSFAAALERTANAFVALGLSPGDRVAIVMDNRLEMPLAMFGAMRAGLVAVPLNTSVSDDALAGMLRDSSARAIVASEQHRARIDALDADVRANLAGRQICTGSDLPAHWRNWSAWQAGCGTNPCGVALSDEDACNIIYSSGTTALPKGIEHTHRRRLDWAYDLGLALRYHSGAVTLCSLGLYSNISWVGMLCTWLAGGCVVITRDFHADRALEIIERERITHFAMVPVQFERLLASAAFDARNRRSLQAVMCCGSPLAPALKQRLTAALGCDFIELYGLTEGLITIHDPESVERCPESVGQALVGTEIRILGEDDVEVEAGCLGEIVGRGRIIMSGYLNRDDASREATWTDAQGHRWLRTGDIGRLDDEGFLYIIDRKKDMILSGGQNIYPTDIETVMRDHPAVAEVAVIGVPSRRWGETPLAVVVSSQSVTQEALRDWANARLGRQQRVAGVIFVDALPRNPNGKVLKRELRRSVPDLAF